MGRSSPRTQWLYCERIALRYAPTKSVAAATITAGISPDVRIPADASRCVSASMVAQTRTHHCNLKRTACPGSNLESESGINEYWSGRECIPVLNPFLMATSRLCCLDGTLLRPPKD